MPIDVHAHYVPLKLLERLEREGGRYGVSVVEHEPTCQKCLRFEYGLQVRPFFAKLVEPVASSAVLGEVSFMLISGIA